MTVQELIDWLNKATDEQSEVIIRDSDYNEFGIEFLEESREVSTGTYTVKLVI